MNPRVLPTARLARSILRTQSDERLAELAANGSDAAFEALVSRHRRSLVSFCSCVVGPTDAEEAAQDALLRALAALRRGQRIDRFAPWLHVIARNVALNQRRAQVARGECAPLQDGSSAATAEDEGPVAQRARLAEVVAAVGALPDRQRDAIVMRELEGRSYAEIAERLNSSPGAVRQLLHRARAGIRDQVAGALSWPPLIRWLSDGAPGGRFAGLSDGCLATAKVCAALVPAAALGAGGLTAIEHGGATRPRRAHATSHRPVVVASAPAPASTSARAPASTSAPASRPATTTSATAGRSAARSATTTRTAPAATFVSATISPTHRTPRAAAKAPAVRRAPAARPIDAAPARATPSRPAPTATPTRAAMPVPMSRACPAGSAIRESTRRPAVAPAAPPPPAASDE